VPYDDLTTLRHAIIDCLFHVKEVGNLDGVMEQLKFVFLPMEPREDKKFIEPYYVKVKRLLEMFKE